MIDNGRNKIIGNVNVAYAAMLIVKIFHCTKDTLVFAARSGLYQKSNDGIMLLDDSRALLSSPYLT